MSLKNAMDHTLSVAEIATAITAAAAKSWRSIPKLSDATVSDLMSEHEEVLVRRIRHWTLTGALLPIGATHSGSGRHRRYGVESVYEAAVLNRLAEWGMPIGILKGTVSALRPERDRGDGKQLWDRAVAGDGVVFLYMVPLTPVEQNLVDSTDVMVGLLDESEITRMSRAAGAVILNLSIIFRDIAL